MKLLATPEIWFVCGSQHLYGPGPLKQVAENAGKVADGYVVDGPGADTAGYQVMILRRVKPATSPAPRPDAAAPMRAL